MKYRAVAFDIDGTLYPSLGLYLGNIGFGLRRFRRITTFSKVRHELHVLAEDPVSRATLPHDLAGFREYQARLFAIHAKISPAEALAWTEKAMYEELEEYFKGVSLFPGVVAAFDAFKRAGIRLAALSDFPAPRKLANLGIDRYFEVAMSSEESGRLKPAPEPFLDLAKRLALAPSEILFVGNSPVLDISGAHNAGMDAVLRGGTMIKRLFHEPYAPRHGKSGGNIREEFAFTDWAELVAFALGRPDGDTARLSRA